MLKNVNSVAYVDKGITFVPLITNTNTDTVTHTFTTPAAHENLIAGKFYSETEHQGNEYANQFCFIKADEDTLYFLQVGGKSRYGRCQGLVQFPIWADAFVEIDAPKRNLR